jgi:minor extracellular serine protease Vpr
MTTRHGSVFANFCRLFLAGILFLYFQNNGFAQVFYGEQMKSSLISLLESEKREDKQSLLLIESNDITSALILVSNLIDEQALNAIGVKVQTKAGKVWSIRFPVSSLIKIPEVHGVLAIEPAMRTSAMRVKMDSVRLAVQVNPVNLGTQPELPQAYNGKGVVVGIVDIGFQSKHPAFLADDSSTLRIKRFWQQNREVGDRFPAGYDYGVEHVSDNDILSEPDHHGTHGTHVAGIASGSGIGSPGKIYRGMAPESDLIFVSIKYFNEDIPGSAWGDYVVANPAIIDAYSYVFKYANSVGKPAVINLSWGMHTGPHDGTSLFDLATDALVGSGKILVGAAGNSGQSPMHWDRVLENDTSQFFMIESGRNFRNDEEIYADFWGSPLSVFSISVQFRDSFGNIVHQTPFISSATSGTSDFEYNDPQSGKLKVKMMRNAEYLPNKRPNILLWVESPNSKKYYVSAKVTSSYSHVHAWNSGGIFRWTSGYFVDKVGKLDFSGIFEEGNTNYTIGENGGSSKSVVSVGAYAAKNKYVGLTGNPFDYTGEVGLGELTLFSSKGPTLDGRIKPDLAAPGFAVAAPIYIEQYPGWATDRLVAREGFGTGTDTFGYGVFSGTSMASPVVTGAVALMLQANPSLNHEQVVKILRNTAISDAFTGQVPNNNYGWGKLNAEEAVVAALKIVSTRYITVKDERLIAWPNPVNSYSGISLKMSNGKPLNDVEIMDLSGRQVIAIQNSENTDILKIDLSTLRSGVYFLMSSGQTLRIVVD